MFSPFPSLNNTIMSSNQSLQQPVLQNIHVNIKVKDLHCQVDFEVYCIANMKKGKMLNRENIDFQKK